MAWKRILTAAGLDDARIAVKLNEMLDAETERFFKEKSLGLFTDNATRMRALELLTELLSKRKGRLEISGADGGPIPVQIIDDVPAGPPK